MFKNVSKEELVIPASMNHLKEVRDFIERIGKKYKFSDKIINSFKLVVDEACTNIIRHGYLDIKDGKITIRAIIRRLSLTIVIIDQGKSFDPRQVQNPDLQKYVQIGKKGGLGILMMRKLMDDIQYNITHRGNELRLTKMRDSVEEPRFKNWWETLSLRRKSFYVTSVVVLILGIVTFTTLYMNLRKSLRNDIFLEAGSASQSFARTNWENLRKEQVLLLNENALALRKSHNHLIRRAMITTPGYQVVALSPFKADEINSQINIQEMEKISQRGELEIYRSIQNDSVSYFFLSPIRLETVVAEPIGYAIIEVSEHYINERIAQERNKLLIYFFAILGVAILGLAFLVTRITEPFHKLADWVRKVGHGQVDQDEIDIDSSDELGEIAQAFNEMTTKFREAQLSVIEQQRMQKELQVAQEIQQMLLPDDFPDVLGYDIASYYQSAKEVGGDLFDFMEVDEHSIGICVADVSGKGVPGSLVMTMIRTSLRLEARGNKNPADILTRVNAFVTDDIKKGMFVTMLYVILDSRERMVWFASAGHNPMILYRGKSRETYYLNPSGFPVGITLPDINLFGERLQADRIRLHPDDILVLYTDGITEAMNPKRELFGEERFLAAIRKYGHLDVVEFVKSVKDEILNFTGGFEQNDDITIVAIKENMAAVDVKINQFKQLFERVQTDSETTVAEACKEAGISPTTFYRYRKIYKEGGYDLLREMLHGYTNLGLRHLSIEVKTKMYDIIRQHPEFGPKKISDMLNTEKYGFTEVSPLLIYEELKRAKLNTKERRIAFVKRGGKQRLKPPGTPLLTLDGQVMVGGYSTEDHKVPDLAFMPKIVQQSRSKEKIIATRGKNFDEIEDPNKNDKEEKSTIEEQAENTEEDRSQEVAPVDHTSHTQDSEQGDESKES